jgi:hypothetical protein
MTPLPWCAVADAIVAVTTLMVTTGVDGTKEKNNQEQDKSWTHEPQGYVNEMEVSETLHRKLAERALATFPARNRKQMEMPAAAQSLPHAEHLTSVP